MLLCIAYYKFILNYLLRSQCTNVLFIAIIRPTTQVVQRLTINQATAAPPPPRSDLLYLCTIAMPLVDLGQVSSIDIDVIHHSDINR